jgi:hypothetical protein
LAKMANVRAWQRNYLSTISLWRFISWPSWPTYGHPWPRYDHRWAHSTTVRLRIKRNRMRTAADKKLAAIVERLGGVTVTHHYRGRRSCRNTYYIHVSVRGKSSLDKLIRFSEEVNAPLDIYGDSKTGYRYCLAVGAYSREIMLDIERASSRRRVSQATPRETKRTDK